MHFPHTPREKQRKRSADRARGERRVREAREIRGWGFGRNRSERNRILELVSEIARQGRFCVTSSSGGNMGCFRVGLEDVASIFQERSELKYPQRVLIL